MADTTPSLSPGQYIAQRLTEPSTWASLGILLTGVGVAVAPEYWNAIMAIGMGVGGLLGVILKERANRPKAEIKEIAQQAISENVKASAITVDAKRDGQ